jgi:transcriptional regulator with XRE-family HTH domain
MAAMDDARTAPRTDAVRREFGAFLRARRARLDPAELGLPTGRPRRTPGLRREEVAQLAGVSVDYYTRLEQGRDLRPSTAVLDALARALRLTTAEREHLFRLDRTGPAPVRIAGPERVRPTTRRILELVAPNPAFLLGRRLDVLAWNRAAATLITDFGAVPAAHRNIIRLVFLDPAVRAVYPEWDSVARDALASLRRAAGRYPDDPAITGLVGELSVKSQQFRTWWSQHDVREKTAGRKTFDHPMIGRFTLDWDALVVSGSDQTLIVYTAAPESPAQLAIDLLATLTADTAELAPPV